MNDAMGNRMKEYESISKNKLTKRVPVILRLDGKAFHTFCERFERPYDEFFNDCMNEVMAKLCLNIQGAKFAERHSDEISILVTDYDKITTDAYFDYSVQKIVSVVSSMATAELCRLLISKGAMFTKTNPEMRQTAFVDGWVDDPEQWVYKTDFKPLSLEEDWPCFDCRCFNIPKEEISNYFWWRMLDAKRNSINMVAQSMFSHKELQGMTCNEMQEKMFQEKGINWNNIPQGQKAGFMCMKITKRKEVTKGPNKGEKFQRKVWVVNPSVATKSDLDAQIKSTGTTV